MLHHPYTAAYVQGWLLGPQDDALCDGVLHRVSTGSQHKTGQTDMLATSVLLTVALELCWY